MTAIWTVLSAVLPVFAIVGAGYFVRHTGKLTAEADQNLTRLTVNLLYPCLILSSLFKNDAFADKTNLLLAPVLGVVALAVGYGLCLMAARLMRLPPVTAQTFAFVDGIFNYGYLAVPLIILLFDRTTLGVLWLFTLGVEATFWTLGFMVLRGSSWRDGVRQIFSPPVLAIILGSLVALTHIDDYLPRFVTNTVNLIGNCAIPIALVTIGATLHDYLANFSPGENWRLTVVGVVLRQVVLPLIFILGACWIPCSVELKRVLVVQAAMPCAMFPILVTKQEEGDVGLALRLVLWTTALAIIAIPLWLKFGQSAVGV
jgi:malate permease and related proteins